MGINGISGGFVPQQHDFTARSSGYQPVSSIRDDIGSGRGQYGAYRSPDGAQPVGDDGVAIDTQQAAGAQSIGLSRWSSHQGTGDAASGARGLDTNQGSLTASQGWYSGQQGYGTGSQYGHFRGQDGLPGPQGSGRRQDAVAADTDTDTVTGDDDSSASLPIAGTTTPVSDTDSVDDSGDVDAADSALVSSDTPDLPADDSIDGDATQGANTDPDTTDTADTIDPAGEMSAADCEAEGMMDACDSDATDTLAAPTDAASSATAPAADEYRAGGRHGHHHHHSGGDAGGPVTMQSEQALLKRFDTDGDGAISAAELASALTSQTATTTGSDAASPLVTTDTSDAGTAADAA